MRPMEIIVAVTLRRNTMAGRDERLETPIKTSATTEMPLLSAILIKLLPSPRSSKSDKNSEAVDAIENVISKTPIPMAAHAPKAIAV